MEMEVWHFVKGRLVKHKDYYTIDNNRQYSRGHRTDIDT